MFLVEGQRSSNLHVRHSLLETISELLQWGWEAPADFKIGAWLLLKQRSDIDAFVEKKRTPTTGEKASKSCSEEDLPRAEGMAVRGPGPDLMADTEKAVQE